VWDELLAACALVLVLEGILPFVSPNTVRSIWENIANMPDKVLRTIGLASMLLGLTLLYLLRQN
jgi:uncharacterized protein YjeT (DUF2065 family)